MAKSHDLWLVGKLRSNPFKCISAYISIFSLSRDIHQTLDKSKTCQCFWKSLYELHLTGTPHSSVSLLWRQRGVAYTEPQLIIILLTMDCMCMREMTEIFNDFIGDESHRTKKVVNFATPELSMNILPPLNKCGLKSIVTLTMGVIGGDLHPVQSP